MPETEPPSQPQPTPVLTTDPVHLDEWPDPVFTIALIVSNVAIWLLMLSTGASFWTTNELQALRWGADIAPATLGGQYWRLFSSNFVHLGFVHLAINMVCLFGLGRLAEYFYESKDFLLLYVYTGLCSGLLSVLWQPHATTAGASGAIFGISGVMLTTLLFGNLPITKESKEKVLTGVLQFTVLNLFIGGAQNYLPGIFHRQVDNAGHIGGLLSGLMVGAIFGSHLENNDADHKYRRRAWLLLWLGFFVALVCAVYYWNGFTMHVQRGLPAKH